MKLHLVSQANCLFQPHHLWSALWGKAVVSNIFYFHLYPWGNDPIWRAYFSDGLVQPPTRHHLWPPPLGKAADALAQSLETCAKLIGSMQVWFSHWISTGKETSRNWYRYDVTLTQGVPPAPHPKKTGNGLGKNIYIYISPRRFFKCRNHFYFRFSQVKKGDSIFFFIIHGV